MKKFFSIIFLSLWVLVVNAQDYLINFSGTGSSTTLETVTVENLTQGKSVTFAGSKTLHLMSTVTGNTPLLEYMDYPMIVYPNPSSGDIIIQFEAQQSGMATVAIYDMSGREINKLYQRIQNGFQSFKVAGLAYGVYTIQVLLGDLRFTQKVVCNSKSTMSPSISYNGFSEAKQKDAILKNATTEQAWQYNIGDRLKFQGTSGKCSTIVMDVPTQSKTLSFDFVECTDTDGNNYSVVKIGDQLWMAENLKTTKYNDGTPILNETDNLKWANLTEGAYCWQDNDVKNKSSYGALYNWYAIGTNKLAPLNWHVATDKDWTILSKYLGGIDAAGGKLKEMGTTHWQSPNINATNEVGFSALPGGVRIYNKQASVLGIFGPVGNAGNWWTLTENDISSAWSYLINVDKGKLERGAPEKENGYSVRCVLTQSENIVFAEPNFKNYLQPSYNLRKSDLWVNYYEIPQTIFKRGYDCGNTFADFNGDGYDDILMGYVDWSDVGGKHPFEIYINDKSNNRFILDNSVVKTNLGVNNPRKSIVGDFNGDSKPDVIFADSGVDMVPFSGAEQSILLSSPNGYEHKLLLSDKWFGHGVCSGDIDNDGDLDVFFTSPSQTPYLFFNDGKANFTNYPQRVKFSLAGVYACEMHDVNKDGFIDLVIGGHNYSSDPTNSPAKILWGNGIDFDDNRSILLPLIDDWGILVMR